MSGSTQSEHRTRSASEKLRDQVIGFVLAVILTAIPFAIVAYNWLTGDTALIVIAILAAVQILVHMRFFLGLGFQPSQAENMGALGLALVLIFLMVGGSLWVMIDLHHRMM